MFNNTCYLTMLTTNTPFIIYMHLFHLISLHIPQCSSTKISKTIIPYQPKKACFCESRLFVFDVNKISKEYNYYYTSGLGSIPALSAISGTLCSHSMAIRWTPATPSISLSSWICSTAIFIPSSATFPLPAPLNLFISS